MFIQLTNVRRYSLLILLLLFATGCSVFSPIHKSKFITIANLIDAKKFTEAKEIVDGMTNDKESLKWSKTWYYKGLLCQEAYMEGVKKGNKSLTELYPNQLQAAYGAYRRAINLDKGGRMERLTGPKLVLLANELQSQGEKAFQQKRYDDSFQAFDFAYRINRLAFLALEPDNNLLYNTALAAYESEQMEKAVEFLSTLHNQKYSTNATHLLSNAYLELADTLKAETILYEGAKNFDYDEKMMLLLTDLLFKTHKNDRAIDRLNEAISHKPNDHKLYMAMGLLHQKTNRFQHAIENYTKANQLSPDEPMVYVHIATCYFNLGVEIEKSLMQISSIRAVERQKAKSEQSFNLADEWLSKVKRRTDLDQKTLSSILELERMLTTVGGGK